jgi:hypothetical protein
LNLAEDFIDSHDSRDVGDPGSRTTGTTKFIQNLASVEAAYLFTNLRTGLAYKNIINQTEATVVTDTRITHIVTPSIAYTDPRYSVGGSLVGARGDEGSTLSSPYWRYGADGRFLYNFTPTIAAGATGYYFYQEPDTGSYFTLGRGRATSTLRVGTGGILEAAAGVDVFTLQNDDAKVRPSLLASYTHNFSAFAVTTRYEQGYRNRFEDADNSGVTYT